ncbi:SH3-like domain-containing protein [Enterovirga rhinocerotis]|uniref:Nitrile hydratase n=1 Tax=Enterovirga rhinocerotis TaxID=1339210 RepID=A0A4V3DYY3_9HYPH|nr:SH3-like domain-containing protein [Enterovirga rhinocerotis]TDR94339.1 nitrile hydratase [Enterovirga rhinocerotis]
MTLADGIPVRVKDEWPEAVGPVHCRTPHYIRGKHGMVVRHLGDFPDPGDIAFEREPVMRSLYHVAFPFRELWPEGSDDELVVEVYDHWLEPEHRA